MLAYTYMERGKFALRNKPVPVVQARTTRTCA